MSGKEEENMNNLILTDLGNISASSFLYRLTGCRDLDLNAGQQTHMLSQAGNNFLEITPISCTLS